MMSTTTEKDLERLVAERAERRVIYDYERGEIVDPETGLVIEEGLVSQASEWRVYGPEDWLNRHRTGARITFKVHDGGLTSHIDPKGAIGKKLNTLNNRVRRPMDWRARKEVRAKKIMIDTVAKLGLPNIMAETVGMLIREAIKKRLLGKKNMAPLVGAMIIEVCKIYGIPIDVKKLREILGASENDIYRAAKKLARAGLFNNLKKRIRENRRSDEPVLMAQARQAIYKKYLGDISDDIAILADRIIDMVAKHKPLAIHGKNPKGVVAAAIYIASVLLDKRKPQKAIAKALGISEVPVRHRYEEMIDSLDIIVYI